MYNATVYKIMFGAPSDIKEELEIFFDTAYGWNNLHSEKSKIILMPMHWSINSYPRTGEEGQKILNKEIVTKSDLLICVFGEKLGTETSTHPSGTVEEIDEHIKAGKDVMIFFKKSININIDSIDMAQITKLREFKRTIQAKSLYAEFDDSQEFRDLLFKSLQLYINDNWFNDDQKYTIIQESKTSKKETQIELPDFDLERLRAWTSVDDPQFFQVYFEGGGCVYGLGARNQYEIKNGREKVEWDSFFEHMLGLGFIDIEKYSKDGHPVYRLKKAAYDYMSNLE
ncbi:MAG: hypothetical protein RR063_07080 [Anaerovoracaceae bacterium]